MNENLWLFNRRLIEFFTELIPNHVVIKIQVEFTMFPKIPINKQVEFHLQYVAAVIG